MDMLVGTLTLRPYVFAFLAAYLFAAVGDIGWRRTALFSARTFVVAWTAEFASTRIGIPFGLYHYTGTTSAQELYIANVPFFDSLSFVFLAYAAWCLARLWLSRSHGMATVGVAGVLMMLLDVVLDPLAVRGARWFLGQVFYYPEGGIYFGVPLSNFAGWVLVGWAAIGGFVLADRRATTSCPNYGVALYYGILVFNLAMTWWIGEPLLLAVGVLLQAALWTLGMAWSASTRVRPGLDLLAPTSARLSEENS